MMQNILFMTHFIAFMLRRRAVAQLLRTVGIIIGLLFFAHFLGTARAAGYSAFQVTVTGKGQPMILIPGATCSGHEWDQTVARYASRYECHVLTLAGYAGTAPLPGGPYLATMQQQLQQYIADKRLKDVILVGHSIGGFLSLCIAAGMKAHLQKVIVVDALPFFAAVSNPNAADTINTVMAEQSLARYNDMGHDALKESQRQMAAFMCRDSTHWDDIAAWGAASDKRTMAWTMAEMLGTDMRGRISAINVPVLVLAAWCENPAYPAFTRSMVQQTFSGQYSACKTCTVHVADGNTKHFVMYDNPSWYFAEIDSFFAAR
jgi:N-formylmaleamate deformylase